MGVFGWKEKWFVGEVWNVFKGDFVGGDVGD